MAHFDRCLDRGGVFHLWGHSWEIDARDDWRRLDRVLAYISGHPGVRYIRNGELGESLRPKLLMASAYFSPRVGGLERYADEVAHGAMAHGYDVVVVTSSESPRLEVEDTPHLRVYRLPVGFKILDTPVGLSWYGEIKRVIREERPDVINVHVPVPYLPDLAALAADVPVVATCHSGSMKKRDLFHDRIIEAWESLFLPLLLRKSCEVVCPSEHVRRTFLAKYAFKSTAINPGVDTRVFTKRDSTPREKTILFVGQFKNELKGLGFLRQAMDLVPDAVLNVVGSGTRVPHPRTNYLGELRGQDLADQIRRSSVLVLPSVSESEGFGMVLVEAMACGVPVIGSDVGGIREIIEPGTDGLLVPARDARALADAIRFIFDHPAKSAELARNAYDKVQRRFGWSDAIERYLRVIEDAANPLGRGELGALLISAEYPPFVEGGLGVHYKELAGALSAICRVCVVSARTSMLTPAAEVDGRVAVRRVLVPRRFPLNHLAFALQSYVVSRTMKPDVVHVCVPNGVLNVAFKRVPTVAKIHSLYQGQQGDFLYRSLIFPLASRLDRYMIRQSDLVMTTSRFMKDSILKMVPLDSERVVAIDNGINQEWFRPAASAGAGDLKSKGEFVILSVGRFVPRKGTMQLVEAFKDVHLKHAEARLLLVGGGYAEGAHYARRLQSYILDHRLQSAIRVVEWVPANEVRKYYDAADLYVHAATYEPFGNVILEAMSVGLPVVLVRAGGPEEVAGDSAVVLDDNQPAGLARAIESFIEQPDKAARFSELSRARARQFSWAKTAETTLASYRELTGARD